MSLVQLLHRRIEAEPTGIAIASASGPITNAALLDRVRGAVRHLKGLGVRPGDVVAVELTNRVEFVVLLFATWRLGAQSRRSTRS